MLIVIVMGDLLWNVSNFNRSGCHVCGICILYRSFVYKDLTLKQIPKVLWTRQI